MFNNRLKELRIEKDITQKDLANILNISPSSIGMYEQGRREPDTETLHKISEFFDVSIDYLLGKSDMKNPEKKFEPVEDVESAMEIILAQPGLMLNGELLSDESKIILANAIQMGLKTIEDMKKKEKENNDK